jgi:uncharacterized membrane protein YczE
MNAMISSLMHWVKALGDVSLARWVRLLGGLWLFGTGDALMKTADLGLAPWSVFADGISKQTVLQLGTVTILVGAAVLSLWVLIKERPGIGTVCNIVLIGTAINVMRPILPVFTELVPRIIEMVIGILAVGLGSAFYLSAQLGSGPRDGLMMGLHRKYGWSVRAARTIIEVTVLLLGVLLSGTAGAGTLAFALGIGPVVQAMFQLIGFRPPARAIAVTVSVAQPASASK